MSSLLDIFQTKAVGGKGRIEDYSGIISSKGDFTKIQDFNVILNSWNNVLQIPRRSYNHDPEYGSDLYKYIFSPADETTEEQIGIDILKYALEQPLRMLAQNAGEDAGYIFNQVRDKLRKDSKSDYGYNAATGVFESMTKAGILDPAMVTKSALINAVSVGTMILTTEVLITDIPEEKKTPAMPTPPMGGGMPGMM